MFSSTYALCVERCANARGRTVLRILTTLFFSLAALATPLLAQEDGGEANLKLPRLDSVSFLNNSISGSSLLMGGLLVSALGLIFGLIIYMRLRNMPVHDSMREVSELIYETCKTYLATDRKSTRLNSSHTVISYAVFCLKKKKT